MVYWNDRTMERWNDGMRLAYFFRSQSNYFWIFCFYRSHKIPYLELSTFHFPLSTFHIVLYHASGDPYLLIWSDVFEHPGDLVFGLLLDRTGIEDYNIRIFYIFCIRKSAVRKHCSDSCAICIIHLASKDEYGEFHILI